MTKHTCPGSSKLTKDGKACELKLDVPLYCGLTTNAVPGWPRCYKQDGSALTIPSEPIGADSTTTTGAVSNKKSLENKCTDILDVQYANLLDSINEIHQFEQDLFEKLEIVENGGTSDMTAAELRGRINNLSKLRNQLYRDLNNILTSSQCNLAESRQNLADQVAMVEIVKRELDNSEKTIFELQNIRNNQRRMVEITTYEKDRYAAYKNIFKILAFSGLGILASTILSNRGFTTLGKMGVVTSIVLAIIFTAKSMYDIWDRNNMNWNRYDFGESGGLPSHKQTVWGHDKTAINKLYTGGLSEFNTLKHKAAHGVDKIRGAGDKIIGKSKSIIGGASKSASRIAADY